jgi:hypothetical protein
MKNDGRYMVDNFGIDMNKIKIIILGPLSFLIILLVPLSVMDMQARGGSRNINLDGPVVDKWSYICFDIPSARSLTLTNEDYLKELARLSND